VLLVLLLAALEDPHLAAVDDEERPVLASPDLDHRSVARDAPERRRRLHPCSATASMSERTAAKYAAAEKWVRAVNHHGGYGTWAFMVCKEPNRLGQMLGEFKLATAA